MAVHVCVWGALLCREDEGGTCVVAAVLEPAHSAGHTFGACVWVTQVAKCAAISTGAVCPRGVCVHVCCVLVLLVERAVSQCCPWLSGCWHSSCCWGGCAAGLQLTWWLERAHAYRSGVLSRMCECEQAVCSFISLHAQAQPATTLPFGWFVFKHCSSPCRLVIKHCLPLCCWRRC